jgi:hypothetical protein
MWDDPERPLSGCWNCWLAPGHPEGETREEFTSRYAARSGMTIERLGELNQEARPCDCGDEQCRGWQMVTSLKGHPEGESD